MKTKTNNCLALCRAQIEEKLGWGKAETWASQDFDELSELIFEATREQISATTLKRVFGRVKYHSAPSTHTLNTLAIFLEHTNWRDFLRTYSNGESEEIMENELIALTSKKKFSKGKAVMRFGGIAVFLAIIALTWMAATEKKGDHPPQIPEGKKIFFQSNAVTSGVPNTVVFNYDLTDIKADSFSIQQSWDSRRRKAISPENDTHTSVYYYPGYFRAKLVANNQVIEEHDVYVKTEGWLAMIEKFPIPIYLDLNETNAGIIAAEEEPIQSFYEDFPDQPLGISYFQVRDFGELNSNNFRLETRIRNTNQFPEGICKAARIVIMCSEGRIDVPFSIEGCVGELRVIFGDKLVDGKTNDLSALGTDMGEWNDIAIAAKDSVFSILLNGEPVFETNFETAPGKIVGLRYRFEGGGEIDGVRLFDEIGRTIWADKPS